jgi:hypothetical protein
MFIERNERGEKRFNVLQRFNRGLSGFKSEKNFRESAIFSKFV